MSVTIQFRFPAGRYHATPWGTHVNEAEVEWPPSPWRILRALIATWHRKLDHNSFPEERLEELIHQLATEPPSYALPSAVHAHSRHYMPERKGRGERKTLVFDAFARVDSEDSLVVAWPHLALGGLERELLSVLVERLGYLGRAESWVEGKVLGEWRGRLDCVPVVAGFQEEMGGNHEWIRVAVPLHPDEYLTWRNEKVKHHGLLKARLKVKEKRLLATLPSRLIDAMRLDTGPVQSEGWSRHPGLRDQLYSRPDDALSPRGRGAPVPRTVPARVTTATFVLYRAPKPSSPLPRMVDALKIGEVLRLAALKQADDPTSARGGMPAVLSGHNMPEENRHHHAFYLPLDGDGDGRIDRFLVHAEAGLGRDVLDALSSVRRLWIDEGAEWRILLESFGDRKEFPRHPYLAESQVWHSVTPYLHPWYRKKGFMHEDQIRRECRERGLPEPAAERVGTLEVAGRELRPVHFHRFRRRKGLRQPDTQGAFWKLTFPEPISGPLALGFGCHFGLGIFRASTAKEG